LVPITDILPDRPANTQIPPGQCPESGVNLNTSHTYAERGTYTARIDVDYTAEIDLGAGWIPITGQLTTTGPGQEIRIYEAHTALVAHTCVEDPDGVGC